MKPAHTLICTVGTSLFNSNLAKLTVEDADPARAELARAYAAHDWHAVAGKLAERSPTERLCGAEINSLTSLFDKGFAQRESNLFFCHSATDEGRDIGSVLRLYYQKSGKHPLVQTLEIGDLQDGDPQLFRTRGLRNLAKTVCKVVRDYGAGGCAINATGGYKAQIAIAVLMGQAMSVPVYYKHERFDEIIGFPPMPVALDFEVWMRASGLLFTLDRELQLPAADCQEDWDDKLESLIERERVDGKEFITLSPTGQIFHETFRERYRTSRDQYLPPPVSDSQKEEPTHEKSGHLPAAVIDFMVDVTRQVPQVRRCHCKYFNPDLPAQSRFRLASTGIEGIDSNGTWCAKFDVMTSAQTEGQRHAVLAALNEWLAKRNGT